MPSGGPTWSLEDVLASRPAIRINQLGYLPTGPKHATLVTAAVDPVDFVVLDQAGTTAYAGRSQPWPERPEPTSGMAIHRLDFSDLRTPGPGFRLVTDLGASHPFPIRADLYAELAQDARQFFYLQRSGCAIDGARAPGYGRPAGHLGVPPNTGDTAVPAWTGPDAERLYPGWREDGRFDVTGGWYDAGDHGKYVTSGALPTWQLLATVELLRRHEADPAEQSALLEECRWQLDWLLRMQLPDGHPYAGLAFHRVHGSTWEPDAVWPHLDATTRVLHRPSTGAALALAAVAAQAARVFAEPDPGYAATLLQAATRAFRAAQDQPRLLAPDDQGRFGGGPYFDDDLDDDFYWAAAELWLTTGAEPYRRALLESPLNHAEVFDLDGFDFDRVAAPARLDLAFASSSGADQERIARSVLSAARRLVDLQREQGWEQPYAPGPVWAWGSNGRLLNNLVVLGSAYELAGSSDFLDAVRTGIDYLFGRNALGQSYVTGYGTDFTQHQRTRHFAHDHDPAFPPPPRGSVAGGPTNQAYPDFPDDPRLPDLPPQCAYLDQPTSETTNDICIRWNAPLVWVATFLRITGR